MSIFDHMGFEVRDYAKSKAFYERALAPLGIKLMVDYEEWQAAGFGAESDGRPKFWIGRGEAKSGPEEVHVCFAAKNRAAVRAFYDAAIAAGGTDNGKPGPRPDYHENYYGGFVLDLDGHNIEACCHHPE